MTEENKIESEERPELPGMGEDPEGFDPRTLPGATVIMDETDEDGNGLAVVAVPLSSLGDEQVDVLRAHRGHLSDDGGGLPGFGSGDALEAIMEATGLNAMMTNFRQMTWAQEVNAAVMAERGESEPEQPESEDHPEVKGGPIFEAFPLAACVGQDYMSPEILFKAHAREIFERVADGKDVRPGTDAEILGVLVEMSLIQPMCEGLVTLYFRLVTKMLPDMVSEFRDSVANGLDLEAYEKIHGEHANDHEVKLREMLTRDREPGKVKN